MNGIKSKGKKMKLLSVFVLLASTDAFAQAQAQAQSPLQSLLPIVLIFIVFYFLMLRPQQKKLKEEQEMLTKLQKGDEIYTKSGLIGTIHGLTEKVVTLDMGEGVKLKVVRSQIGGLAKSILEVKEEAKK